MRGCVPYRGTIGCHHGVVGRVLGEQAGDEGGVRTGVTQDHLGDLGRALGDGHTRLIHHHLALTHNPRTGTHAGTHRSATKGRRRRAEKPDRKVQGDGLGQACDNEGGKGGEGGQATGTYRARLVVHHHALTPGAHLTQACAGSASSAVVHKDYHISTSATATGTSSGSSAAATPATTATTANDVNLRTCTHTNPALSRA